MKYTTDHEWIKVDGATARVGITRYAAGQLGDVVFVELPELETEVNKGDETSVVESVKAASDVYTPVSGEIVAVNEALEDAPETVNSDPEGEGWFFKVKMSNPDELNGLMDKAAYDAFLKTLD